MVRVVGAAVVVGRGMIRWRISTMEKTKQIVTFKFKHRKDVQRG